MLHGDLEATFQHFSQDTRERWRLAQGDPERPVLPPEALFLNAEQFYLQAKACPQVALRPGVDDIEHSAFAQKLPPLTVVRGADDPLARLQAHLRGAARRPLVLAESDGRRQSLLDFLRASGLNPPAFDTLAEFEASTEPVGIATAALAANVVLIVAALSMLQATLTLPGIAGIVLTMGMAVDANVLIYERIREELRNGNSPQAAIHAGFDRAFDTILDSNLTTLIAAIMLFGFGTGPIKGFAVTLSIGILTSMFTAVTGSRALVNLIYGGRKLQKLTV